MCERIQGVREKPHRRFSSADRNRTREFLFGAIGNKKNRCQASWSSLLSARQRFYRDMECARCIDGFGRKRIGARWKVLQAQGVRIGKHLHSFEIDRCELIAQISESMV